MAVNEGSYSISGRFGEGFFLDPSGRRAPRRIIEATQIQATIELAQEDVMLSGNRTGKKDGPESISGTLAVRKIDSFFENLVLEARAANLAARRAARDSGVRLERTFTLQVWEDDPDALGKIGHQLDGVRINTATVGFDFGTTITSREYPFTADDIKPITTFERIGDQIDPKTGLPAVQVIGSPNG
jgi:hypothetical protein